MKLDKDLLRTVLFAVGVVAMACWMPLLYWRQQERVAAKIAEQEAKLAQQKQARTPAKSTKKRR